MTLVRRQNAGWKIMHRVFGTFCVMSMYILNKLSDQTHKILCSEDANKSLSGGTTN